MTECRQTVGRGGVGCQQLSCKQNSHLDGNSMFIQQPCSNCLPCLPSWHQACQLGNNAGCKMLYSPSSIPLTTPVAEPSPPPLPVCLLPGPPSLPGTCHTR
jgi:hypothetical protein